MTAVDPFVVAIDRATSATKLAELASCRSQIDGSEPYVRIIRIDGAYAPQALLPVDAEVRRCVTTDTTVTVVATLDDATLLVETSPSSTTVHVASTTDARAESLAEGMRRYGPATPPGQVQVRVWHHNGGVIPSRQDRSIDAPTWTSIEQNYPSTARRPIGELMALNPPAAGKLILWHGDPGTGKTTAIRSLMHAWQPWCQAQYVADPERFFADPGYLTSMIATPAGPGTGPAIDRAAQPESRWRLIIAEDSDEYLRASARRDAGAALGRLLNLADGILGHDLNVLTLLTTNEPTSRLHPALVRPGRCLATIEFPLFSKPAASQWLGRAVSKPMTLAELLEVRGDLHQIAPTYESSISHGQYL